MNHIHILKQSFGNGSDDNWHTELQKTINNWIKGAGVEVINVSTNIVFNDSYSMGWFRECIVTILYKQK